MPPSNYPRKVEEKIRHPSNPPRKVEDKIRHSSNYPRKVEEQVGNGQHTFIFQKKKMIKGLDYGLGQPAAAKSGQKQPGLEVSCLDRTGVICSDRTDICW